MIAINKGMSLKQQDVADVRSRLVDICCLL